jgi:AraC-like DNA-binding protein
MQLILPPGAAHSFRYPETPTRWVTYKFALGEPAPAGDANGAGETAGDSDTDGQDNITGNSNTPGSRLLREHPTLAPLFETLAGLAPAAARREPQATRLALSLLEAVCSFLHPPAGERASAAHSRGGRTREAGTLRRRVDAVLQQAEGRPTAISEVARAVGLSPGHLSNRFSQENGVPLKRHIDGVRFSFAKELLEHADLPISLVSDELGFPDVYSFSRFVRRLSGRSPREIRGGGARNLDARAKRP